MDNAGLKQNYNTQTNRNMKYQIKSALEHGVIVNGKYAIGSYIHTYWGNLKVIHHIISRGYNSLP